MSSAHYMSHFPNFSLDGDQDQGPTLTLANDPSLIYPFLIDNSRDLEGRILDHEQKEDLYPFLMNNSNDQEERDGDHDQKEINKHIFMAGSSTPSASLPSIHGIMSENRSDQTSFGNQFVTNHELSPGEVQAQWMSSKVRFVRKMSNDSDRMTEKKPRRTATQANQQDKTNSNSNNNPSNGIVRVCSACNTTKTPLWRSGPCGPKSLCNACGIRQRKARRAALAAANCGIVPAPTQTYKVKKDKRSVEDRSLPIKKRCKISTPNNMTSKKITTKDEIIIGLSKNSAFNRVFPQDETDAAILLMALSCSLVRN